MMLRTRVLIGLASVLMAILFVWIAREAIRRFRLEIEHKEALLHRPPTRDEVARIYPEAVLAGPAFKGLWADWDYGAWLFEYEGTGPSLSADLLNQLQRSGWSIQQSQQGTVTVLWKPEQGEYSSRLRLQGFPDRLLVGIHVIQGKANQQASGATVDWYFSKVFAPIWEAAVNSAERRSGKGGSGEGTITDRRARPDH